MSWEAMEGALGLQETGLPGQAGRVLLIVAAKFPRRAGREPPSVRLTCKWLQERLAVKRRAVRDALVELNRRNIVRVRYDARAHSYLIVARPALFAGAGLWTPDQEGGRVDAASRREDAPWGREDAASRRVDAHARDRQRLKDKDARASAALILRANGFRVGAVEPELEPTPEEVEAELAAMRAEAERQRAAFEANPRGDELE